MLEQHNVLQEFPEHRDRILALARENEEFGGLVDAYNSVDEEVFKLESAGTPVSDTHIETLKKRRLDLKDRIFAFL